MVNIPTRAQGDGDPPGDINQIVAALNALSGRNVIRNGDMVVAQRGNGNFTSEGANVDGWNLFFFGGSLTVSRVAALGAVPGMRWLLQYVIASQASASHYTQCAQRIEGVDTLAGQIVTLSFQACATSGTPKIGIEVTQNFGTSGAPSSTLNTVVSAVTISTTLTKYFVTFTMPSVFGKSIGTDNNSYLQLTLWLSSGSTFATRASNIGFQNNTFQIGDIQLEAGPEVTPFERIPQQQQLAWCQRYFWRMAPGAVNAHVGVGIATTTSGGIVHVPYPVTMRAIPTFASGTVGNWQTHSGGGTATALNGLSTFAAGIASTGLSWSVAGAPMGVGGAVLLDPVNANAYGDFTAEL